MKSVEKTGLMLLMLALLIGLCAVACGDDSTDVTDGDTETADGDNVESDADATDGDEVDGDVDVAGGDEETAVDGDSETVENDSDAITEEILPFLPAGPETAPDPMAAGPFPVGVKTFDFYDESRPDKDTGNPRWLRTDIWYPATQAFKDGPFEPIDLAAEGQAVPDLPQDIKDALAASSIQPIPVNQVRDADIDRSHGPYPVLLFSHGANGIRWQSVFYTLHLASHGYIVVSCDHENNVMWDLLKEGFASDATAVSASIRPVDMSFLLDRVTEFNNEEGNFFQGMADLDNVGISGHSLGGLTSIITPCQDSRIKVTVPHSPVIGIGMFIGGCSSDYPVPTMIMGGTDDQTLPWCQMYCDYKNMMDADIRYMYELVGGGHYTFSDICRLDLLTLSEEIDLGSNAEDALTDGCGENNVPFEKGHQTINHYATAFLNWILRGSPASEDYLIDREEDPFDTVNFYKGDVEDWWGDEGGCDSCQGGMK